MGREKTKSLLQFNMYSTNNVTKWFIDKVYGYLATMEVVQC